MSNHKDKIKEVIAKALADAAFKKELKAHPHEVLAKHGIQIAANVKIEVLEERNDLRYLVLPNMNSSNLSGGGSCGIMTVA